MEARNLPKGPPADELYDPLQRALPVSRIEGPGAMTVDAQHLPPSAVRRERYCDDSDARSSFQPRQTEHGAENRDPRLAHPGTVHHLPARAASSTTSADDRGKWLVVGAGVPRAARRHPRLRFCRTDPRGNGRRWSRSPFGCGFENGRTLDLRRSSGLGRCRRDGLIEIPNLLWNHTGYPNCFLSSLILDSDAVWIPFARIPASYSWLALA